MTTSPAISFVIPVRNDATRLKGCLESIAATTSAARIQVTVVDNGSHDGSPGVAARAGATVLTIPHHPVSELRNRGVAASTGPLVAFVDADHLLDRGWVAAAVDVFTDPTVGAAGAPCVAPADANWIQRAYDRFRPRLASRQPVEWMGSGNMIVRRDAFERVGGFDRTLETCEDVDLCNRLRTAGYQLVGDPRFLNVHLGDPTTLRGLFYGELWRGRDNLKVTLRGPLTARALPSLVIPLVHLACLAALPASVWLGWPLAAGAGATFIALTGLRAARMTRNNGPRRPGDVAANLVVAAVYDIARALSLVVRATHRTRRQVPEQRPIA